jgi:cytochrome P450
VGRDPQLHADAPERFDVLREDKEHLSFGFGPHYCLGVGIARLVARTGLSRLFERFPELSLAVPKDELQPLPTFIMNGHRGLPVRLTAQVPAAVA